MTTHVLTPQALSVRTIHQELRDTHTLTLTTPPGTAPFKPGQFNMLYTMGWGEIPISISGDPADQGTLVHTIRAVGNASQALVNMKPGDQLGLRGPFGTHWPLEPAAGRDVVVIAGGIGLAPLRPLIYQLAADPDTYKRIVLLYGARTPEDILFEDQLLGWKASPDIHVRVTVDQATPSWHGNLGPVTKLISGADFDPVSAVAYVCGPEIMMRFVISQLMGLGFSADRIYLSMERNMKCAVGFCGHCQYGSAFICKDGPIFTFDQIRDIFSRKEV